jgi:signal transduction histidine kinase
VAIDVEVDDPAGDLAGLPRDREVVLLRSAQEALANVRRHAHARLVTVRLSIPRSAGPARAVVEVQDDGIGFEPAEGAGFGLTGMRDRVREAGGELEVDSAPGRGTRVRACVPVELTAPAEDAAGVPVTP